MTELIGPPKTPEGVETNTPEGLYEAINVVRDTCRQSNQFGTGRWADEMMNYGYPELADWVRDNRTEFILAMSHGGPEVYIKCDSGVKIHLGRRPWS